MTDLEAERQAGGSAAFGTLAAGVAHAVRNPLFGISAIVDALESGAIPDDELPESLALLRQEVARLNRLAAGLVELGTPVPARRSRQPAQELVEAVLGECSAGADEKRVVFQVTGFAELPPLAVDRRSVRTALRHVVENAIEHAPQGSAIRLCGRLADDGLVAVEVHEDGPGFPADQRQRLLEPFVGRRAGGSGLGLAIAARVVRHHGGGLDLGNAPEGGGRVVLTLPAGAPAASAGEGGA